MLVKLKIATFNTLRMAKTKKTQKKNVLVTGAGGYIGSVLVEKLLRSGYKVRALDTYYWGLKPLKHLINQIEIVKRDVRNITSSDINGFENIVHTAGLSNDPMADFNPRANFEINTKATIRFAKICKEKRVKKFIFASSASIYDKKNAGSILQDEKSNVSPTAAYSLSKFKAEKGILKLASNNFCPIIFRQGTVYGYSPRLRYDLVVNTMLKDSLANKTINVFAQGTQWRPLVDVTDVAKAYVLALESENKNICGEIFNLLYKNFTMLELSKEIRSALLSNFAMNIQVEVDKSLKSGTGRNYKISNDKLKKYFGWAPKVTVRESVANLVKQIRKNKNTDYYNPKYYNIEWMKLLIEAEKILKNVRSIF